MHQENYRPTSIHGQGVIGPMDGVIRDGAGGLEGPGEVGTAWGVPPLVTARPGHGALARHGQVVQRPRLDGGVVPEIYYGHHEHGHSDTFVKEIQTCVIVAIIISNIVTEISLVTTTAVMAAPTVLVGKEVLWCKSTGQVNTHIFASHRRVHSFFLSEWVSERERERVCVCVCVREREREREVL